MSLRQRHFSLTLSSPLVISLTAFSVIARLTLGEKKIFSFHILCIVSCIFFTAVYFGGSLSVQGLVLSHRELSIHSAEAIGKSLKESKSKISCTAQ